jgi:hypothetical protein
LRNRFKGRVVCGHCCSLAVQPEEEICRTLDLCATGSKVVWFVAIVAALRSSLKRKFAEPSTCAPRRVSRWSRCQP